jgi:ankyrin repeat protein
MVGGPLREKALQRISSMHLVRYFGSGEFDFVDIDNVGQLVRFRSLPRGEGNKNETPFLQAEFDEQLPKEKRGQFERHQRPAIIPSCDTVGTAAIIPVISKAEARRTRELVVEKWIKHKADKDNRTPNEDGRTLMFRACSEGRLDVVKHLFEMGAKKDIHVKDNAGFNPMWIACHRGHLPVAMWLFKVGANKDIFSVDTDGFTPSYSASQEGHLDVVQWLFEVGTAADFRTKINGKTPLEEACVRGHLDVARWLILQGVANVEGSSSLKSIGAGFKKTKTKTGTKKCSQLHEQLVGNICEAARRRTFLLASLAPRALRPPPAARPALWKLEELGEDAGRHVLQLITSFGMVVTGQQLQNARDALAIIKDTPAASY